MNTMNPFILCEQHLLRDHESVGGVRLSGCLDKCFSIESALNYVLGDLPEGFTVEMLNGALSMLYAHEAYRKRDEPGQTQTYRHAAVQQLAQQWDAEYAEPDPTTMDVIARDVRPGDMFGNQTVISVSELQPGMTVLIQVTHERIQHQYTEHKLFAYAVVRVTR